MNNIDILVPDLPESVVDASVVVWHKKEGEMVRRDEIIVEIETDKVVLEVPATETGIITSIKQPEGATVVSRQLLGQLRPADLSGQSHTPEMSPSNEPAALGLTKGNDNIGPAVRRLIKEHQLDTEKLPVSGHNGRITRQDVERYLSETQKEQKSEVTETSTHVETWIRQPHRNEKRVPMTRLRKRIAQRLLETKNNTAMLTTFNEVNMKPVMDLRLQYGEQFEQRHGVKLGFMSFYVKAVLEALKRYPEVNASLDNEDIVYHNYFDISIAVSTPRGLVTPVLRDVDALSMAEIEKGIKELSIKGRENKLSVDDLSGGNFTITNGGVFGSLMSTPLINPPQSAILGVHAIKDRPVAVNNQVVILPMMYLALSYDHQLIDGREAVGFLVTVRDMLEDPARLLLDV